jgi:PIN domain nuclease of toxin-antitoxin system
MRMRFSGGSTGTRDCPRARRAIADEENEVLVSVASVWEITTKARIGKLPGALDVALDVGAAIAAQGFTTLAILASHAQRAGSMPGEHRDRFDRMLAARAIEEAARLVSNEKALDAFGPTRLW